jgi:hypothetical protein
VADDLPPAQYLVMEVLAARARTGDDLWPFPSNLSTALRSLEDAGLVTVMHGSVPRSLRARLTEAGRIHSLEPGYVPPNGGIDRLRGALEGIAELAEKRAGIVPGMESIAVIARAALYEPGGDRG